MTEKRRGRPRKTDSGGEKLENKDSVRLYAQRMRESGRVHRSAWIKTEVWDEIQRIAKDEDMSAGEVIERAVIRGKKNSIPQNTPTDN